MIKLILYILAIICFWLKSIHVDNLGPFSTAWLGIALFATGWIL